MAETTYVDLNQTPLPFSTEAEQSVLGAILIDPPALLQVADILKAEYFYIPQHKAIYQAMTEMFEFNSAIDFVTLLERLKSEGTYDDAGGKAYLNQLMQSVPSSANIVSYAEIIRTRYYTRSLILASQSIIEKAAEGASDADELLNFAEQRIYEIRQGRDVTGLKHIKEILHGETYDRLNKLSDPVTRAEFAGIPTGFPDLDRILAGLHKSNLIIIGARPGMGKTAFALNLCKNIALESHKRICFFALEMSRDELAQRLLSDVGSVPGQKLRSGEIDGEEWRRVAQAGEKIGKSELYIDESAALTVNDIKAKVRRMGNVDLVVVDHLGLLKSSGPSSRVENRVQVVSEFTRDLKNMAKELDIPLVVCAQLNRGGAEGAKKRPQLTDLRESGSIEQDADIVLFIHREGYYRNGDEAGGAPADDSKAECIVAKNRHGETNVVHFSWDAQYARFLPVDHRYESY